MFDFCVSNPPYQIDTIGNTRHRAIYHRFMGCAQKYSSNVSMIYPTRWMRGGHGEGLREFREKELNSRHYSSVEIITSSDDIFPGTSIAGGVNIVHWRFESTDDLLYIYDGDVSMRTTLMDDLPSMIINPNTIGIVKKVSPQSSLRPHSTSYYGEKVKSDYKIRALNDSLKGDEETYRIFYSGKGGGVNTAEVPASSTTKDASGYKVFVSSCASSRQESFRRVERSFLGGENDICSQSYIQFGGFDTKMESERCLLYLKSDLVNFLFGVITNTQHVTPANYELIPDVDFTTGDIIGTGYSLDFESTQSLDEQMREIYDLDDSEWEMVTSSVRSWDSA